MIRISQIALTIGVAVINFGCATPAYFGLTPQKYESPQVRGQLKGTVELELTEPVYIVPFNDASTDPPDSSEASIQKESPDGSSIFFFGMDRIGLAARVGVSNRFEISGRTGILRTPSVTRLKYLGDAETSQGWLGSVFASYLYMDATQSRESSDITGNTENIEFDIQNSGYDVGIVFGNMIKEGVTPYLLVAYSDLNSDIDIRNIATDNTYEYNGRKTTQLTINPGFRVEGDWGGLLVLEGAISKTSHHDLEAKWLGSVGLLLGIGW